MGLVLGAFATVIAARESASSPYTYDPSGNLTTAGNRTFSWNYNNLLTQVSGTGTSTYAYDHAGQRVWQIGGGATSTYPTKFFSVATSTNNKGTSTEYIYAGGELVATVEGTSTASAVTRYNHPDHLGSTNVVSDANKSAVQTLDYYPYGGTRIDTGTDVSQREFIGQFLDEQNGLSYLNARYYESARGQFLSQDPVFLAIGNPNEIARLAQQQQKQLLSDPQLMHAYGYARNNPIVNKDPTGLVSANTFFRGLDVVSNIMFARTAGDYWVNSPGETPREQANDRAQFYFGDGPMFVAGQYLGYLTPQGMALNVGGIILYGLDKYCSSNECRNFDPGNRTPEETAKGVISGDTSRLPIQRTNGQVGTTIKNTVAQQLNSTKQSVSSQISAIRAQIKSIQTQVNALMKRRADEQSKSAR